MGQRRRGRAGGGGGAGGGGAGGGGGSAHTDTNSREGPGPVRDRPVPSVPQPMPCHAMLALGPSLSRSLCSRVSAERAASQPASQPVGRSDAERPPKSETAIAREKWQTSRARTALRSAPLRAVHWRTRSSTSHPRAAPPDSHSRSEARISVPSHAGPPASV